MGSDTTVYVDLYFMINFSMDFLCLYITARLLCPRVSPLREALAAAVGGGYAVAALFLPVGSYLALAIDAAACLLIVAVAFFRPSEPFRLLLYAPVFAAISMILGGVMTALFNLLNKTGLPDAVGSEGDGISVWLFALLAIISGAVTLFFGGYFKGRMSKRAVDAEITFMGKTVRVSGMSDSGNLLKDPIFGRPCIVADIDAIAAILPEELYFAAKSGAGELCGVSTELQKRIVLVPTRTATADRLLVGIRPDSVRLLVSKKGYGVDAPVVLTELKGGAGESKLLVPAELLA